MFVLLCYVSDKHTLCFVFECYVSDKRILFLYFIATLVIQHDVFVFDGDRRTAWFVFFRCVIDTRTLCF